MENAEYATLRAQEDRHWWFCGLRRLILENLRHRLPACGSLRLLDLGCGTGGMLQKMRAAWPGADVHGIDLHSLALGHARERATGTLVQGTANALPYLPSSFDAVIALDLFYALEVQEERALGEAWRVLAPGGLLVVNLPAFELLRGAHDRAVHTRERYTAPGLAKKLQAAGFDVLRLSYWNTLLFPLVLAWRRLRPSDGLLASRSDVRDVSGAVNFLCSAVLGMERLLLAHVDLPFGSSVFAVARKTLG